MALAKEPNDRTRYQSVGRRSSVYVIASIFALAIVFLTWWSGQGAPALEARRVASIQLRMLRQARDRLENRLQELDYKAHQLSQLPAVLAAGAEPKLEDRLALEAALGRLDIEAAFLRRYGTDGRVLWETPMGGSRAPRLPDTQLREMLDWGGRQENLLATIRDLDESPFGRETQSRGLIRFCVPTWSGAKDEAPRSSGILCLWIPTSTLFDTYLIPTHLLPESNSFVLSWRAEPSDLDRSATRSPKEPPTLLWHSSEPQWVRSTGRDANAFLAAIRDRTEMLSEAGGDLQIVKLPRRDGHERQEVFTYVPVVFGAQRLILCLSTPYSIAVEFMSAQNYLLFGLGALALVILVAGLALLAYQRSQLEVAADEQQRRQLREVQHDYRELFSENPTAMFVVNDEGNLLDCNHSAERLIGRSRIDSLGTPIWDLFDEPSVRPVWETLRQQGTLHTRDWRVVRKNDHAGVLAEMWGRRIGDHWILMAHDVEQRRDLEQQITRLKRMDSMGSLASTLAHDFNNLLGQVQILVSNLRTEVAKESAISEDLSAIEEKVDDASQLVANLLTFREDVVAAEPVWLEPVLREFVANQKKVAPTGVELALEIRRELPSVWITPHALRRVLGNLWLNAIDAMPYGGTISIRADVRRIAPQDATDQLPADLYVSIEVVDTGAGMSPEILEAIFEPFFTTKKEGKGTGLGLWTVYKLVRRLGGGVHVRSHSGRGTSFTLYLPHSFPRPDSASARPTLPSRAIAPAEPLATEPTTDHG